MLDMNRLAGLAVTGLLGAGLGCGAATLNDDAGDDDVVDAGPTIDAADTTPPQIVSSSPDEGATHVSVLTSIEIVFDEPLDPDTVNTTTIKVRSGFAYGGQGDVVGPVSYDEATRTVTLDPILPLFQYGSRYE